MAVCCTAGKVRYWDLPYITEAITAAGIDHLHLDGELYIHGKTLQEMSRLIKKHRPESLDIEYHIYDQILDLPFKTASLTCATPFRSGLKGHD